MTDKLNAGGVVELADVERAEEWCREWRNSAGEISALYEAFARHREQSTADLIAGLREAREVAGVVLDGLNARIDAACAQGRPAPVFAGIADLHDFIGHLDTLLSKAGETE